MHSTSSALQATHTTDTRLGVLPWRPSPGVSSTDVAARDMGGGRWKDLRLNSTGSWKVSDEYEDEDEPVKPAVRTGSCKGGHAADEVRTARMRQLEARPAGAAGGGEGEAGRGEAAHGREPRCAP